MTTISVIIPTINEAEKLPLLLQQIEDQGFHEVIVADASTNNATETAAKACGAITLVHLPACRGRQMQAGAQIATGDILFFLHADSILPEKALESIAAAMSNKDVIAGSFRLKFDQLDWRLSFYAWCSRCNLSLTTFGDQGLFMSRETYQTIGGFAAMAILEDLEIQRRLRPYGRFLKLAAPITTSARRFLKRGIIRQQVLNILIVTAYLFGVSPKRLASWYYGRPPSDNI